MTLWLGRWSQEAGGWLADGGGGLSHLLLSPSLCRDPQEEVGPLEHPSCPALEVLQPGRGGGGVLAWRNPPTPAPHAPVSPPDSTNSGESMYTIMNPVGPGAGRANVSVGSRVGAAEGGGSAGDLVARVPRCPPARSSRSALVRRAPWRP